MLEIHGVTKSYGSVTALAGVDLTVSAGQVMGLLGPNGAGKTTLVSIVAGLRKADLGTVTIDGTDTRRHPERVRRLLGLAPQELGIYPTLTTRQNLVFFAELAGLRGKQRNERVDELVFALQLSDKIDAKAGQLSGGQKRRLHTAMALLSRARLLLLDEPTAGADISTRARLLDVVSERAAEGTAVLYSTHYLPEIEQLDADVAIISAGRIIVTGSCEALIGEYGSSIVELTFDGLPHIDAGAIPETTLHVSGNVVRVETAQPEKVTAAVVQHLADRAALLQSVSILRPSLDSVYLTFVGERYESTSNDGPIRVPEGIDEPPPR